jgi:hypothetical protein
MRRFGAVLLRRAERIGARRADAVARRLGDEIASYLPDIRIEHHRGGLRLSGRGLLRRWLLDAGLRWLGRMLR